MSKSTSNPNAPASIKEPSPFDDVPPEPGEPMEPGNDSDIPPSPQEPTSGTGSGGKAASDASSANVLTGPAPVAIGTTLGSYVVERQLGAGGMAQVYLGRRIGAAGFEREVAIKRVLTSHEKDAAFRQMFLDEARLAARLQHRNIAQVHDLFEKDEALFLVMEYIQGQSLRDVLKLAARKQHPFTEGFGCFVIAEVADALSYAHAAKDAQGRPLNIVHRDVTPHNVMVATSGDIKLLDFGIAYSTLEGRGVTESGTLKGKFAYMSPEQAKGDELLDGRSDIFSAALILVELLTGKHVFETTSESKTLMRICEARPEDVHSAIQTLPERLQVVIRVAPLFASPRRG